MKPMMIINFKTYEEATGKKAAELAKIAEDVAAETGTNMVIAVQPTDIQAVSSSVSIPVFAQHIDPVCPGKHTGHVTPEAVKASGASGTLLNHAERPLSLEMLKNAITKAKLTGLKTVVCAGDEKTAMSVAAFEPDMISIEPPELISSGVAVSVVRPEMVANTVKLVRQAKRISILCGAGIRKPDDIREALKLGASGVMISSGFVLAGDRRRVLSEMAKALCEPQNAVQVFV